MNWGINFSVKFVDSCNYSNKYQRIASFDRGIRRINGFPFCTESKCGDCSCVHPLRLIVTMTILKGSVADLHGIGWNNFCIVGGFRASGRLPLINVPVTGQYLSQNMCCTDHDNGHGHLYWADSVGPLSETTRAIDQNEYFIRSEVFEFNRDTLPWQYIWADENQNESKFSFEVELLYCKPQRFELVNPIKYHQLLSDLQIDNFHPIGFFDSVDFEILACMSMIAYPTSQFATSCSHIVATVEGSPSDRSVRKFSSTTLGLCSETFQLGGLRWDISKCVVAICIEDLPADIVYNIRESTIANSNHVENWYRYLNSYNDWTGYPPGSVLDYILQRFIMFSTCHCTKVATYYYADNFERIKVIKSAVVFKFSQLTSILHSPYNKCFAINSRKNNRGRAKRSRSWIVLDDFLSCEVTFPIGLEPALVYTLMLNGGERQSVPPAPSPLLIIAESNSLAENTLRQKPTDECFHVFKTLCINFPLVTF